MNDIETARLRLRMFSEKDVDAYAAMCRDPEVMRFVGEERPFTRAQTWCQVAGFIGHWQMCGYGVWALEERDTGELVGQVGFVNPAGWPGIELSWFLDKPQWGRGLATEAAHAALRCGYDVFGFDKVIGLVHPDNFPSVRVALRLGGRRSGTANLLRMRLHVYDIDRQQPQPVDKAVATGR